MTCEWLLDEGAIPAEAFAAFLEAGMPEDLKPYAYGGKVDDSAKL